MNFLRVAAIATTPSCSAIAHAHNEQAACKRLRSLRSGASHVPAAEYVPVSQSATCIAKPGSDTRLVTEVHWSRITFAILGHQGVNLSAGRRKSDLCECCGRALSGTS